jgi:hypothetical protein
MRMPSCQKPGADEGADDTNDNISNDAKARPLNKLPGKPAGDQANDQNDHKAFIGNAHDASLYPIALAKNSEPASPAVIAAAAEYHQSDEKNEKGVGIHGNLLGASRASLPARPYTTQHHTRPRNRVPTAEISPQLFFAVTWSHFSPSSFLIASTFFQASSFMPTNAARAAT